MAITQQRRERNAPETEPVSTGVDTATKQRGLAGVLPTVLSILAVGASLVSVYIGILQAAQLEVYLPSAFQYAMDSEGENFTIPITIANDGARSGTVISMELEVEDAKTKAVQRFYSAYLGEHPQTLGNRAVRQFAPMAVLGHAVVTETVRFYPIGPIGQGTEGQRIVSGPGEYSFRLKINTAAPAAPSLLDRLQGRAQPAPVAARMLLPVLDHRGVMQMRSKAWMEKAGR